MSKKILEVNFTPPEDMDFESPKGQQKIKEWIQAENKFPGLEWKIWIKNEDLGEVGGVYLFEDEQSLEKYRESVTMQEIHRMHNVSIRAYDIEQEPTQLTNGPI